MVIQEDLLVSFGADIIQLQKSELLFAENNDPTNYFQIRSGKIKLTNFRQISANSFKEFMLAGIRLAKYFFFPTEVTLLMR